MHKREMWGAEVVGDSIFLKLHIASEGDNAGDETKGEYEDGQHDGEDAILY
ncbi:hypothetical protein RCC89_17645 [Cytophagaceae bacterium ABcell3]|nr:hypothetical protein RCC89_17645 [Cytophagaceae bacterium ABcell3]